MIDVGIYNSQYIGTNTLMCERLYFSSTLTLWSHFFNKEYGMDNDSKLENILNAHWSSHYFECNKFNNQFVKIIGDNELFLNMWEPITWELVEIKKKKNLHTLGGSHKTLFSFLEKNQVEHCVGSHENVRAHEILV